jgi:hypothetical protein
MYKFQDDIEKIHRLEEYINQRITCLDEEEDRMFTFYELSEALGISIDDLDRLLAFYAGGNASGVTF